MTAPLLRRPALLLGLVLAGLVALSACSAAPDRPQGQLQALDLRPDLPVSNPPFDLLEANWKHRLAQPYVYLEARGSYTSIGGLLAELVRQAAEQNLEVSGPPFGLYFDDPGQVPVAELRMRACLPIERPGSVAAPLAADVLPSVTVVYAYVSGPYPEVPRAYPSLYRYMDDLGWREDGPVRESYLVNPGEVGDYSQLVTEIQIPATSAR